MPELRDLTGERFGRLKVLYRVGTKNDHATWQCVCDCGNTKEIRSGDMVNGRSTSCGCLRKEMVAEITKSHEMAGTRLYAIWALMKQRCTCEYATDYKRYGGRGITVCREWMEGFEAFKDWALANGYTDNLTIDRIDVNGNYEPANCRWVDVKTQNNNRRSNRILEFRGEKHNVTEWSEITGIPRSAINNRLRYGWTVERALTEKPRNNKRKEVT